ncbi:hypothetical protein NQ314_020680 [Rhamnusium bicolor]|uniref:Uncharacterized protein n=1 Tax=Rhamnusium bicolor TaxID=1586634 RepID=A0AAV8WJ57_9CUCU|nr:hypothetical protein NQ314_020680 [Rhamnusium bicolor]
MRSARIKYSQNLKNWTSYIGGHEILKWQGKVHGDPNEFINLCSQFEIYPDVWALQNWSNWVTPPAVPIRFDTMFFFSSFHQMPDVHKEEKEVQDIKVDTWLSKFSFFYWQLDRPWSKNPKIENKCQFSIINNRE